MDLLWGGNGINGEHQPYFQQANHLKHSKTMGFSWIFHLQVGLLEGAPKFCHASAFLDWWEILETDHLTAGGVLLERK